MIRALVALFITLHGLVHLWPATLGLGLVEFRPEMGWTGRSWLFSSLLGDGSVRTAAAVLFTVVAAAFVVSGVGLFVQAAWWRPLLAGSAIASSAILVLFWDGNMQMLVEKGLLGLIINVVILAFLFARPA